jgi:hypothetical protein
MYNRPYYEACDALLGISKQTVNINKLVLGDKVKSKIIEYVPHGLNEEIFKPFTDEDTKKLTKYKSLNLTTSDPVKELGSVDEVELWMELRGPDFKNITNGDEIFGNLPEELQKKYIGLGNELDGNMVKRLAPAAMTYYVSKKKEKILLSLINIP